MLVATTPFFCNLINMLYCTFLKPVLKCGPYYVDSFVKKVDVNISFICEDIKEKVTIFFVGGRKNVFQFKMSATMVRHLVKCWPS